MSESAVTSANLGSSAAAFTCRIDGKPAAVINTQAAGNPELQSQALRALLCIGLDAGVILGALNGIRSRPLAQDAPRAG